MNAPRAIFSETKNLRTREAMLLGSGLEGGWASPYPVGDQGTSFGPYQMHDGRGGLSQKQAENARTATKSMMPSYESAVNQISDQLWNTDPDGIYLSCSLCSIVALRRRFCYYSSLFCGPFWVGIPELIRNLVHSRFIGRQHGFCCRPSIFSLFLG